MIDTQKCLTADDIILMLFDNEREFRFDELSDQKPEAGFDEIFSEVFPELKERYCEIIGMNDLVNLKHSLFYGLEQVKKRHEEIEQRIKVRNIQKQLDRKRGH